MQPIKLKTFFRDGALIVLITFGLMAVLEALIRLFLPQELAVAERNNVPIGMRDSILGHVYRPNTYSTVRGPEYAASYETNAAGMRDRTPHPMPKPDSTIRVLLLGDSFTFGIGVDYDSTWGAIFERQCREHGLRVDVVKAGISGYDTRLEYRYLQRLLPLYTPDIVVVAFLPNDLVTNLPLAANDSLEGKQSAQEDSVTVHGQADKLSHFQLLTLAKRIVLSNDYLYTKLYFNTNRSVYFSSPMNPTLAHQMEITKRLLAQMHAWCSGHNARCIVLSIPQEVQVIMKARGYIMKGIDPDIVDNVLSGYVRTDGFAWNAALPALTEKYRSDFQDVYFRMDGHLNAEGNRIVGNYLFDVLAYSLH